MRKRKTTKARVRSSRNLFWPKRVTRRLIRGFEEVQERCAEVFRDSGSKRKKASRDRWATLVWAVPAIAAVLVLAAIFRPKAQYPISLTSAKVIGLFQRVQTRSLPDRVAFWSEKLMNDPSLLAPLGSGPEVNDTTPLFPQGYDCTTYVETVGALSQSEDGQDIADKLVRIRYKDGKISYENRNHFPEADWIPNNEKSGVLDDVTVRLARKAGFVASFVNKDIDKMAWFKSQKGEYVDRTVARAVEEPVTVKLPYLPIGKVLSVLQHLPQGAILNVVRENKERHPVLISHQGFLIWKNGVAYFRHASRNKQISEMPFDRYLRQARAMPWKVLGFNVNVFRG